MENNSTKSSAGPRKAILWGAVIAVFALSNLYWATRFQALEADSAVARQDLEEQVASISERLEMDTGKQLREVLALKKELDKTAREAGSRARSEARKQSDRLATSVAEKQRKQQDMLLGELGRVDEMASKNGLGVNEVRGEVTGVRGDLDETREGLRQTESALRSTQGGVDQLTGKVGEQGADIHELKVLNERSLTGFNLAKSKKRTRVGDIQLRLRKTDAKGNKYSIEILADDKLVVKKDRHLNEPVQFYVQGATRPYEVVVTGIKKDRVVGYVAQPKGSELRG